ncbi:rna exonuclease 3 [Ophiostoma piceae UAMH 11346]|uniref:Rna exonuclease 3 n=1 Tax=Ophiostoma piceae (strain UAMH 11346) TaxID=1262450 RepID=S3BWR8_OPHP1|nr:rna exonuclease 3 [Ophiostoma piceae UAMH 11346]
MSNITQALFKHIPCPNGDSCTTAKCLFGHSSDYENSSASQSPGAAATEVPVTAAAARATATASDGMATSTLSPRAMSYDGGHIAKRARTSSSGHASYDPASPGQPTSLPARTATSQPNNTRTGTISPPPLKRKREELPGRQTTPGAGATTSVITNRGHSATTTAPSSSTSQLASHSAQLLPNVVNSKAIPPLPKRKAEILNPRYVAKAPAKHEIRLRLLKLIHSEFTRLNKLLLASKDKPNERKLYCLTEQGLIWAALDLEENYATTKSPAVYSDSIKHRIMEYKRMTIFQWIKERKAAREAKEKVLKERKAAAAAASASEPNPSTAIQSPNNSASAGPSSGATPAATETPPPKPIDTGLPPEQEFVLLEKHFLTPIDGLAHHGYVPRIPSSQDIQNARDAEEANQGWEQCDRCQSRFQVFPGRRETDGALASGGQCQHHPGRYNRGTQIYSCCNESADLSVGCEIGANHVFKSKDPKRMAALWNFVETPANPNVPVDQAVCFDCEMAYTVNGMEVVRLTVTSWPEGEKMLDVLVRPKGEIIDLNSRYSGIWPKDIVKAIPFTGTSAKTLAEGHGKGKTVESSSERPALPIVASPEVARSLFHSLIRPETVLIGHALENDLNTMRMVHPRLSDTVLLFPHPKGLPIRNGLRVLAREHMGRLIQAATLTGHDSAEDARAAGDLVRTKIKAKWDSMQLQGWRLVGRELRQVR